MKKIISILSILMLGFMLNACNGDGDSGTDTPDAPIPEPFAYKTVVRGDGAPELSAIIGKISSTNGKMLHITNDDSEVNGGEIVFGDSSRTVSGEAKDELEALIDDEYRADSGYIIYKDSTGNIAIYWNDEALGELVMELFLSDYCDLDILYTSAAGVIFYEVVNMDDYIYDQAWAKVEAVAPANVVEALKSLYAYIDGSAIADWMANLWEPYICVCGKCEEEGKEIACYGGAFYYANSARDYEGFLPDVESTRQALGRLATNGAFEKYGDSYANALPDEIKQKIITFCQNLQDKTSGYFYHPQWGSNIGAARRGRDLGHATDLLSVLGSKPLYPTALDHLSGTTDTSSVLTKPLGQSTANAVASIVSPMAAFEDSLASEASYLEWLYSITANIKVNTAGAHTLASVRSQIKAAGYLDITMDYLDAKLVENYEEMKAAYDADPVNNPKPTGLWQKTVDYNAVWGLLKLYGFYNATGRALSYPVEAMETCVAAIMIDADEGGNYHMNDVYNMWGAPNNIIRNAKVHNPDLVPELYRIANENAKLAKFRQEDGTFGYNQGTSSPTTQGVPVSLGFPEGDVNAVALAMDMYNCVYSVLGYSDVEVKLCDWRDGERFINTIMGLSSAKKNPLISDEPHDFDDIPLGMTSSFASSGGVEIVADPTDPVNNVLKYTTKAGGGDRLAFKANGNAESATRYIFEADLCLAEAGDFAYIFQFNFGDTYMIDIRHENGKMKINDNATATSATKYIGDWSYTKAIGEWVHIRIEYDVDPDMPTIRIYFDGELYATSHNYYDSHIEGLKPHNGFDSVNFWAMKKGDASLLIDNLYVACETAVSEK